MAPALTASHRLDRATLDGVAVLRLGAWPAGSRLPLSFALDPEANLEWTRAPRQRMPSDLRWCRAGESAWRFEFSLPRGVRCLGLGERYGGLNLRSRVHTLFATDEFRHTETTDAMYKCIPWLLLDAGDACTALFIDSPAPQRWDLDSRLDQRATVDLLSRRGFELYHFGPAPIPALVAAFTRLTGRSRQPPTWSLGHHQSRWSYETEARVREVAREYRERRIPCDTLVLDIDYMDAYRVFTVSSERFPRFDRMIRALGRQGFHLVPIVDPGVARTDQDATYRQAKRRGLLCRRPDGEIFVDRVWPGAACFPDFLRPEVRFWWGKQIASLIDRGVAGIWNDMNEPAFFDLKVSLDRQATGLPPDGSQPFLQETPEGPAGHLEVRNLYGMQMARASWDALCRRRPDERPFVLTRSCYAGAQRHGAVWLGDNTSWFEHLRISIPMLINVGLSGIPFCGVDVGGFGGDADAELLIRWYQTGIFYPFFRNHCAAGQRAQEPWAYGPEVERTLRHLIEARYRLIPYLERLFVEHRETGAPLMRPLGWHYPKDPIAARIDDQFLLGSDLLVAPILDRGREARTLYLPAGRWHPFDGGAPLGGGRFHSVRIGRSSVPAWVRDGAILPLADPVVCTRDLRHAPVTFRCFGPRASGRYWQDDGATFACERGVFNDWQLDLRRGKLTAQARHAGYRPPRRQYFAESGRRRWALSGLGT